MEPQKLTTIYETLKKLLGKYEKHFNDIRELPGRYSIWQKGDLLIEGRKRKEIYFCGLIIQSSYVGFYYMPVYAEPDTKRFFPERLQKLLKGKSCFHIKDIDDELLGMIADALEKGVKLYQDRKWI